MVTKRVVIVGIPGVGKTTVVNMVVEQIKKHKLTLESVVFGTLMFEEAKNLGIKHRDEMRKLPVDDQRKLQIKAAEKIVMMKPDFLFVDTHLMINTKEGYWPGLPFEVLRSLSPSNLILIEALPHEIISRRTRDSGRLRDSAEEDAIDKEMEIARGMLNTAAIISGAPLLIVMNKENHIDEAAKRILKALDVI
ncbi:MAG: adenylate kinase [Candidatus Methylarchaceae archaeon HK02M2]|nr:adenylate kinase [Candidatus Methylarchaceae archaeon HK02M2]